MKKIVVVFALLFSHSAFAGFMAEPILGLSTGSITGTIPGGGSLKAIEYTLLGGGVRIGYRWGAFWTGLEGTYFTGKAKGSSEYDMTDTNIGLLLGYDFSKYRVYAGYMPTSSTKLSADGADLEYKGTAFKIGFGYTFHPRMSVNVEYLPHTYEKIAGGGAEVDVSSFYGSLKNDSLLLTFGYMF